MCNKNLEYCFYLNIYFIEYIRHFASSDMADSLSATINGQSSSNNQTNNDFNNSNDTNKNESDDEVLSDFSEDEAADMDLE